jgi:hypothetical protein
MKTTSQQDRDRELFLAKADQMFDETYEWRDKHPDASLDEIVEQLTLRRRKLMGALSEMLACQQGRGEVPEGLSCQQCGGPMVYKGRLRREVEHFEADINLKRAYYHCPHCKKGVFPPGPSTKGDQSYLDSGDSSADGPFCRRDSVV